MPGFNHLYEVRPIAGGGSDGALQLSGADAPPAGFEVVPSPEARALVDYILSLKKDYKVPVALKDGGSAGAGTAGNAAEDGSGT